MEYTNDTINDFDDYNIEIDADCVTQDYDDADYYQHLIDDNTSDDCDIEFE